MWIIHRYHSECTGSPIGTRWFRMVLCIGRNGVGEILYCHSLGLDMGFKLIIEFIGYLVPLTTNNYDNYRSSWSTDSNSTFKSLYSIMSSHTHYLITPSNKWDSLWCSMPQGPWYGHLLFCLYSFVSRWLEYTTPNSFLTVMRSFIATETYFYKLLCSSGHVWDTFQAFKHNVSVCWDHLVHLVSVIMVDWLVC